MNDPYANFNLSVPRFDLPIRLRFARSAPAALLLTLSGLFLAGCGDGDGLAAVEGTVTLNGQPLENATVEFRPAASGGAPSSGKTDERGRYRLMYTFEKSGAPPGAYIVSIQTSETYFDDQGNELEREERVPPQYNARSELRRTVENGRNTIHFDL